MNLNELAQKAAGNWKKFDSFYCDMSGWEEDGINPDLVATVYTSNRDSTLMAESNEFVILKEMEPFLKDRTARKIRHSHWACGYIDGLEILVYDSDGRVTPAFQKYAELQERIEDYPILDECDYSEREYEATIRGIEDATWSLRKIIDVPEGYAEKMYTWFSENDQAAIENSDDTGGYPSDKQVKECFDALGWYPVGVLESFNNDSENLYCSNCDEIAFTKAEYALLKEKSVELKAIESGLQLTMAGFALPERTDESIQKDGTVFCPHCHAKLAE